MDSRVRSGLEDARSRFKAGLLSRAGNPPESCRLELSERRHAADWFPASKAVVAVEEIAFWTNTRSLDEIRIFNRRIPLLRDASAGLIVRRA